MKSFPKMTGDDELKGVPFICWYYLLSVTQVTDTDLIQPNLPCTSKPKPSRKRTNWLYVLWFFSKPLTILCHITWHFWHVISQRSLRCCIEGFSDLKLISSALTAEALSLNLQLRLNLKCPLWELWQNKDLSKPNMERKRPSWTWSQPGFASTERL